jgi:hypothetical protein
MRRFLHNHVFGFVIALLLATIAGKAEPLNILIGDLTFPRPAGWLFDPPTDGSPALSRFVVPNGLSKDVGDVRFYLTSKATDPAIALWKTYFEANQADQAQLETITKGPRTAALLFVSGTLKMPKDVPKPGHALLGAVIPCGDKFIHVRFTGPKHLITAAAADFRTMITTALEDADHD